MIARVLVGIIKFYKRFISPRLPNRCRFYPTCADYAAEAIERHGALRGGAMAVERVMRCHPLTEGGHDPVPEVKEAYLLTYKDGSRDER